MYVTKLVWVCVSTKDFGFHEVMIMMGASVKSSRKYSHSHQETDLLDEEEEEEEEGEGGSWLQLRLGSFGATATANSTLTTQEDEPAVPDNVPSSGPLTVSRPQHQITVDLNQDYTTCTSEILDHHHQHPMSMTSQADAELPRPLPSINSSKSGLWFSLRTSSLNV